MVPRLRGQDLLFGGAETLDFAPPSNKISDYWGGSCPPCPPITTPLHRDDANYYLDESKNHVKRFAFS